MTTTTQMCYLSNIKLQIASGDVKNRSGENTRGQILRSLFHFYAFFAVFNSRWMKLSADGSVRKLVEKNGL